MKVGVLLRQFKHTMLNIIKCIKHTVATLGWIASRTKMILLTQNSKKKFSSTVSALQKYPCCIWCDGQDRKNLLKIETDHVDTNVKAWTERTNNYWLLGKPISQAADAYAGDTYYHLQWYLQLKDLARAEDRRVSAGPSVLTFTSVAIAQIVALTL